MNRNFIAKRFDKTAKTATRTFWFVAGACVAGAAAWLSDPADGARRRHMVYDKMVALGNDARQIAVRQATHQGNRIAGTIRGRMAKLETTELPHGRRVMG